MTVYDVRVALNSAIFPLYTQAAGMTIIQPENDENWDRNNAANTSPDKGVPQVLYMHNVMPIAEGFQSIGYTPTIAAYTSGGVGVTNFDQAYNLIGSQSSRVILVPALGTNYIYDAQVGSWAANPANNLGIQSSTIITTATINQQTYFCYSGIGVFIYNADKQTIVQQVLNGITNSQIKGICASNGYLIIWTSSTVAWSSLVNPLDFIPSIQTGAGGGSVQQAKGAINFCLTINGGFILYCDKNAVAASYTNNINFPFLFVEVANSGGCQDPNQVAWQQNSSIHYVLGSDGLQAVNLSSATNIFPEVTDFLGAQLFEDFNEQTLTFSTTYLANQLYTKLYYIQDRFLIFSYGQTAGAFTHAIVYDTTLGRYGKLKAPHVCIFEYNLPNLYAGETYGYLLGLGTLISSFAATFTYSDLFALNTILAQKQGIAVLANTGAISLVNFELSEVGCDGVFILGKYQFKRGNFITHQQSIIESVNPEGISTYASLGSATIGSLSTSFSYSNFNNPNAGFTPYIFPTLDGKTFLPAFPLTVIYGGTGLTTTYGGRVTGKNISLGMIGAFNLTTVVIKFTLGGFR